MQKIHEDDFLQPRISLQRDPIALQVEIETQRLCIRSYDNGDFENCVSLYGNERLTKYFDHGKPRSRLEVEELIQEKGIAYFSKGEPFGLFSIFHKKDMAFMGQMDLVPSQEPGAVEFGCILLRQYHNQAFCPEAVRALVFDYVDELNHKGYTYKNHPINKVIVTTHPKNYASKRIIESIGMKFDKSEDRFGNPRLWYSCIPKSISFNK